MVYRTAPFSMTLEQCLQIRISVIRISGFIRQFYGSQISGYLEMKIRLFRLFEKLCKLCLRYCGCTLNQAYSEIDSPGSNRSEWQALSQTRIKECLLTSFSIYVMYDDAQFPSLRIRSSVAVLPLPPFRSAVSADWLFIYGQTSILLEQIRRLFCRYGIAETEFERNSNGILTAVA